MIHIARVVKLMGTVGMIAIPSCAAAGPTARRVADCAARDSQTLRKRAERFWQAKVAGDCRTAFLYEEPAYRTDEAAFMDWCKNEDPFRVLEYAMHDAQTEGDLGWVRVVNRVQFARAPNAPIEEIDAWDKWHKVGEEWLPVNKRDLTSYPEAPALRDKTGEDQVRSRFAQMWAAVQARDWHALYELTDPADRSSVSEEQLGKSEGTYEHEAFRLRWVEVIGDRGRARVTFTSKLLDPNLTKLPPKDTDVTQFWVRRDGEWFLDLKRP